MERAKSSNSGQGRFLILVWLAFYAAWYWIAPALATARGQDDEAAWLPMWLNLTMFGILVGVCAWAWPRRWSIALFAAVSAIHVAVGLGMHPT